MAVVRTVCVCVLVLVGVAGGAWAQTTGGAYYDFLLARHLEGEGDAAGALAALERAAAADPMSADIRAEIAAFQFRRNQRDEAEKAANAAIALDPDNVDANRVLGLIAASRAENERNTSAQTLGYVRDSIAHLEKAVAGCSRPDAQLHAGPPLSGDGCVG